ncbi:histone-like protein [Mycobacterium leprae Kyoto-2]|uniref:Histone-like protein n=3 Tax=Mycobacterium leprae TaxID=1769 RepID=Q9CDD1_MYCLE|nr:nucleoid-structuring protein H-NS [Mycobacterium leprae]CAR70160.1 histone-like protein [Mycobacterium leprae Br4923]AWV47073.1 nucleoid-structuring protein H-NS [Mycobacterium leprae]OAR21324.1 nucleoid-structuring protein H-NS [Mycobacterium leprae 3125609]OAX71409.1 nucleoid-structuring protein H-NS [Mycobacterium leprae 7935681]CAC29575.1 histone-like protein [Mycobacterium leprae]
MADQQNPPNSEPDGTSTLPAKKVPAKAAKAPAKKAPPKSPSFASPQAANQSLGLQQRIETNGQLDVAKDVAEQAQSAVEGASNPVPNGAEALEASNSPVALVIALAIGLLALLLIHQLRRR